MTNTSQKLVDNNLFLFLRANISPVTGTGRDAYLLVKHGYKQRSTEDTLLCMRRSPSGGSSLVETNLALAALRSACPRPYPCSCPNIRLSAGSSLPVPNVLPVELCLGNFDQKIGVGQNKTINFQYRNKNSIYKNMRKSL